MLEKLIKELEEAEKARCNCSGFVLQYEGGCQCGYKKRIENAQNEIIEYSKKTVAKTIGNNS
jgi:hypothetical protein